MHRIKYFVVLSVVFFSSAALQAQTFTVWTAGTGDWHQSSNWDSGVPDLTFWAEVNQGEAHFSSSAMVGDLVIGYGDAIATASVSGTTDLTVQTSAWVGWTTGTGAGNTRVGTGSLSIENGDINILGFSDGESYGNITIGSAGGTGTNNSNTSHGTVQIQNGDLIAPIHIRVGQASGTGTNNTSDATGVLSIQDGQVLTNLLYVGVASGTGSARGNASGVMMVTGGDIVVKETFPDPYIDESFALIGSAGGASIFQGVAKGSVTLVDGDFESDLLYIGIVNNTGQVGASASADGELIVINGDVSTKNITLGTVERGFGTPVGLFQQIRGITTTNSLTQGLGGTIVLGIGGSTLGDDYSQIQADDVLLDGVFEARFVDGYLPQPGDVFELMVADNISGGYSLEISGINVADYPNLQITQTSSLIRLSFLVPEPSGFALLSLALLTSSRRYRRVQPKRGLA